jgi:hypothetical protein
MHLIVISIISWLEFGNHIYHTFTNSFCYYTFNHGVLCFVICFFLLFFFLHVFPRFLMIPRVLREQTQNINHTSSDRVTERVHINTAPRTHGIEVFNVKNKRVDVSLRFC